MSVLCLSFRSSFLDLKWLVHWCLQIFQISMILRVNTLLNCQMHVFLIIVSMRFLCIYFFGNDPICGRARICVQQTSGKFKAPAPAKDRWTGSNHANSLLIVTLSSLGIQVVTIIFYWYWSYPTMHITLTDLLVFNMTKNKL